MLQHGVVNTSQDIPKLLQQFEEDTLSFNLDKDN
jgi:hypothetical protein